jgi:pimeloyl-ACP methyl ester carboxylesterase
MGHLNCGLLQKLFAPIRANSEPSPTPHHCNGGECSRGASLPRLSLATLLTLSVFCGTGAIAFGTEVVLKDGRVLQGKLGKVAGLAESPQATKPDGGGPLLLIILLDDDLRRTYFSERLAHQVRQEENRQVDENFAIRQRTMRSGQTVKSVGQPLRVQPFDEYGRRIFTMVGPRGSVDVIQGITELTPRWTRVEGISHVWDMRIATSSIPRDVLQKILWKQVKPKEIEHYKKIARFYLQCEYYGEARQTLEKLLAAFPDQADLKEQLAPSLRAICQLSAERLLSELKLRRDAGQHRMVAKRLKQFPADGVGGEVLQGVREMIQKQEANETRRKDVARNLVELSARIPDTIARENLKPILNEMGEEIGPNTLDRMAAFLQNANDKQDDKQVPDTEKVALAISGWLLGVDSATDKLATAISAYKVRRLILEYLNGKNVPDRERTFGYLKQELGGDPTMAAELLAHMKPPIRPPEPAADKPGYYEITVPGLAKGPSITYCVQLPPEYDPYRRYPAILTLHGETATAEQQIDWWAGTQAKDGQRAGQATRYGYIVIAPMWTEEHQKQYGYSAQEHAAVLNSLRDACRRFAIDTDRVFLSGHSIGGDAAWDIGLAHPDLWAGVIPIVAQADRYCTRYWENAKRVPFYVVAGELDGGKMAKNAVDLDRYLRRGYNSTVIEYLGRGHEDFYDEILRIFDWMGRFRRDFFPREFTCETMRPWDNYFWWVEVQGLPPRSMVEPTNWPPPNGAQPVRIKATINNRNGINIQTGTSQVTVWLSPKMIDFKQRSTITVNGRRLNSPDQKVRPDLHVLLEDVRTRGDRQHPFWAKVEGATGRKAMGEDR